MNKQFEKLLKEIESVIKSHPDFIEGDYEYKNNKNYDSLLLCNIAIFKITELKSEWRFEISKKCFELFSINNIEITHQDKSWIRINLNEYIQEKILDYIIKVYEKCVLKSAGGQFGCCNSFLKCSDEKRCISLDKYLARACMYRINLNNGYIFYGKNRNI